MSTEREAAAINGAHQHNGWGSLVDNLRRSVRIADLAVVFLVPVVLLLVFQLPEPVRRAHTFHYANPAFKTAFTSHYVHLSPEHLLTNVGGFLLLAVTTYVLFALSLRRRFFLSVLATILFVFPVILSILNLAAPRNAIGFGFSGVNAALLGLLPVALITYGRHRVSSQLSVQTTASAFLLSLAVIALFLVPVSTTSMSLAGVALTGAVLNYSSPESSILRKIVKRPGYGDLFVVGGVLWMGFLVLGFGLTPTFDGALVNHYVHLLGYCLSFMTTVIMHEQWYNSGFTFPKPDLIEYSLHTLDHDRRQR